MIRKLLISVLLSISCLFSTTAFAKELHCLASAVYREANAEPEAGQLAVAQVVMNRVRSPHYPNSVCGVIAQRGQFPWYHKKGMKVTDTALRIARMVYGNPTGYNHLIGGSDVMYFNHVSARGWARGNRLSYRRTIGRHAFYSNPHLKKKSSKRV